MKIHSQFCLGLLFVLQFVSASVKTTVAQDLGPQEPIKPGSLYQIIMDKYEKGILELDSRQQEIMESFVAKNREISLILASSPDEVTGDIPPKIMREIHKMSFDLGLEIEQTTESEIPQLYKLSAQQLYLFEVDTDLREATGNRFLFDSNLLKKWLVIQPSQSEEISDISGRLQTTLETLDKEQRAAVENQLEIYFKSMMEVLAEGQKKGYDELIGKPLLLLENLDNVKAILSSERLSVFNEESVPISGVMFGENAPGYSTASFLQDHLWFQVLFSKVAADEAEISAKLYAKINERFNQDKPGAVFNGHKLSGERKTQLLQGKGEWPELLKGMLSQKQRKRVEQLELQARLNFASSFGLLSTSLADELDFSPDQVDRFKKLAESFQQDMLKLAQSHQTKRKEAFAAALTECLACLEPKQRERFSEMFGSTDAVSADFNN